MPGTESLDNRSNEPVLDSSSSSVELNEDILAEEAAQPAAPPDQYFCVYQLDTGPMNVAPFSDLHSMVTFIREESQKPGFRLYVFEGNRLQTTRFPAPHLILQSGERVPLFDTRVAYSADSDGLIGPPVPALQVNAREVEPNPFEDNRRR